MKDVKTARGRNLNMAILAAQNEETRAISNVPVNAKGDIIDNRGNVKVPREKVSKEYYKDNLTGIEDFIGLIFLECQENQINSLNVSTLSLLKTLDIR